MKTDPTPPPPFKIIPAEYLLNGGTLPGDAKRIYLESVFAGWRDSFYKGEALPPEDIAFVRSGLIFYASAQLDHECFKRAPSGTQVTTESAAVEPAPGEPNTRWHEQGDWMLLRLISVGSIRALIKQNDEGKWFWEHWPWQGQWGIADTKEEAMRLASRGWVTESQSFQPQPEKEVKEPATQSTGGPAPEPQYRMLEVGEVIQEGDEIKDDSCPTGWRKTGIRCKVIEAKIRRPIDAAQPAPAPSAAKLSESGDLIARVREQISKSDSINNHSPHTDIMRALGTITFQASQLANLCETQQARIAELEKERDVAIHERESCHWLYDKILELCGHDPKKGHPGVADAVEVELGRLKSELSIERDDAEKLRAANAELRKDKIRVGRLIRKACAPLLGHAFKTCDRPCKETLCPRCTAKSLIAEIDSVKAKGEQQ